VYASAMTQTSNLDDVLNISLTYQNGSIGNIAYFANGSKSLPKERIEIYSKGNTIVLNDFKKLSIYGSDKPKTKKLMVQDKGQKTCVKNFIKSIKQGNASPIPIQEIFNSAEVCFGIIESLRTSQTVSL